MRTALAGVIGTAALMLALAAPAAGHSGHFVGEFATATVDGVIGPNEYEGSCEDPVQAAGGINYFMTICEVNDETNDYWAIQISDPTEDGGMDGDSPIVWFDNNHDGFVQTAPDRSCGSFGSPVEDWIGFFAGVYVDSFYCYVPPFAVGYGDSGTFDGTGSRNYVPGSGWTIELAHPLDSGDPDDYELGFGDAAGWCFTYDDGSNPTNAFYAGEIQFPPGCWVDVNSENDAVAGKTGNYGDVDKESELHDQYEALQRKFAKLKAGCKPCPPELKGKLREKINEALEAYRAENERAAQKRLAGVLRTAGKLVDQGELPDRKGTRLIGAIDGFLEELQTPGPDAISAPGLGGAPGSAHAGANIQVGPDGQPPPREPRPFGR